MYFAAGAFDVADQQYLLAVRVFSLFCRQWIAGQQHRTLRRSTALLTERPCDGPAVFLHAMAQVFSEIALP